MIVATWLRQVTSIVGLGVAAFVLVGVARGALSEGLAEAMLSFATVLVAIPEHPHVPVMQTRHGPRVPVEEDR